MLFTFPSRYSFTIGLTGVFSLAGWSRRIHTGFHVPRATQDTGMPRETTGTELSSSAAPLSSGFPSIRKCNRPVLLPRHGPQGTRAGLGCSPFARHYWGNHCCFLFLGVLRCFSSPRSPPHYISAGDRPPGGRVVPFGNPRIKGHLRLPAAYRSLSRPSSPP